MNLYKRIFIIGHHGAGKALVAKSVAEKLGWQFIDADFGLEARIGQMLPEIIGDDPNSPFHHCESTLLTHQLEQENIVVTTDPSIVLNEKNRQLLSSEFVVYLKVSTAIQIERTQCQAATLLPQHNKKTFFDQLHTERDEFYEQVATILIDTDDSALEKHVAQIVKIVLKDQDIKPASEKLDTIFFHKNLHVPVCLTEQQARCLKFLSQGKSAKETAREMNISYRTVEGNLAKTLELLGCTSSKELVALYHSKL